jgi:hypothetical protein
MKRRASLGPTTTPLSSSTHIIRDIDFKYPSNKTSPNVSSDKKCVQKRRTSLGQMIKETSVVHSRETDLQSTGWTVSSVESGATGGVSLFSETGWSTGSEDVTKKSLRKPRRASMF